MECQAAAVTALSAARIIKICRRRAKKKRRSRRVWVKPWLLKKQELSHVNLITHIIFFPLIFT